MSTREAWLEVVEEIAAAPVRTRSPALARLYRLAVTAATTALARFPSEIQEQVEDLVHDLLHEKLDAILEAHNPRGLFVTAIRRSAIDLQRRDRRLVQEDEDDASTQARDPSAPVDEALAARQEAERLSATLSPKERQVFAAIAAGEEREDIARAMGTSRANIDQIVSRARKRIVGAP